jgi:hypothetical protein
MIFGPANLFPDKIVRREDMSSAAFLLFNVALAFYNVGTVWAHELDIFRSWKLIDPKNFGDYNVNKANRIMYNQFRVTGRIFE